MDAITELGRMMGKSEDSDPLTDPAVLAEAIRVGILDAPHLKGNPYAAGQLETRCIEGGIDAWSKKEDRRIFERERLSRFINRSESVRITV